LSKQENTVGKDEMRKVLEDWLRLEIDIQRTQCTKLCFARDGCVLSKMMMESMTLIENDIPVMNNSLLAETIMHTHASVERELKLQLLFQKDDKPLMAPEQIQKLKDIGRRIDDFCSTSVLIALWNTYLI